jgi:hypothetical protein
MVTKKAGKKKNAARRSVRRKNDLLRELLQLAVKAIEGADRNTQSRANIKKLRKALGPAIQELKAFPGTVQKVGG